MRVGDRLLDVTGRPILELKERYTPLRPAGYGDPTRQSHTYIAAERASGREVFVKDVPTDRSGRNREKGILYYLRDVVGGKYPQLQTMREHYSGNDRDAYVFDKCPGGDLEGLCVSGAWNCEKTIRDLFKGMVTAVKQCHEAGIYHGDIKPDK
ncbi:unnamed protein product [Vitrella brassicaformis CCMP3155]|uniref:Protein kinase domain-containing protein n=1 Tax=Vitrella brassicaformis (strain CCMP3155) TaxID=1169540 RepID=A0A0G4EPW0_VITBC|nr:unnamed protein product [Vitrella brassicaformis CCMP3155]|eukprot:CEL99618.1 unnamed protein product [Vitrella brassicaformis CCMP3155]